MKIFLHELSDEPTELHFTEQDPWLVATLREAEESPIADPDRDPSKGLAVVDLELRKHQDVVFLKGKIKANIGLLCSRCANSFAQPISSCFEGLFTHDKTLSHTDSSITKGVAYSEPTGATAEDLDIEFLDKEYLELADVIKEQIYLQIPFQPLCKEGCKGICAVCGQDQNANPCQCHRIRNTALGTALRKAANRRTESR